MVLGFKGYYCVGQKENPVKFRKRMDDRVFYGTASSYGSYGVKRQHAFILRLLKDHFHYILV
jgi:hypothetical protein